MINLPKFQIRFTISTLYNLGIWVWMISISRHKLNMASSISTSVSCRANLTNFFNITQFGGWPRTRTEKFEIYKFLFQLVDCFATGKSLPEILFFAEHEENMRRTWSVQKLFWMSETISLHDMFSTGLSLEFSCIELVSNSMNNLLSWYCGLLMQK